MNPDLDQTRIDGTPSAIMPDGKIARTGKKSKPVPVNQGELMNPDKIKRGNLPQDQEEIKWDSKYQR